MYLAPLSRISFAESLHVFPIRSGSWNAATGGKTGKTDGSPASVLIRFRGALLDGSGVFQHADRNACQFQRVCCSVTNNHTVRTHCLLHTHTHAHRLWTCEHDSAFPRMLCTVTVLMFSTAVSTFCLKGDCLSVAANKSTSSLRAVHTLLSIGGIGERF